MKTEEAKYEGDILTSFEKGEWQSVPNLKDEIARYAASAAATLNKRQANQHSAFFSGS